MRQRRFKNHIQDSPGFPRQKMVIWWFGLTSWCDLWLICRPATAAAACFADSFKIRGLKQGMCEERSDLLQGLHQRPKHARKTNNGPNVTKKQTNSLPRYSSASQLVLLASCWHDKWHDRHWKSNVFLLWQSGWLQPFSAGEVWFGFYCCLLMAKESQNNRDGKALLRAQREWLSSSQFRPYSQSLAPKNIQEPHRFLIFL